MPERKWIQMNGRRVSRNFGVYREADVSLKTGSKILLILACLSAAVIIICFTTLSIIKIRGRNRLEPLLGQKQENIETTTEKAELKIHRKIDLEWTTSLPETEQNRIRFPDEKEIDRLSPRQGKVLERSNRQKAGNQFYPQYPDQYPQSVFKNPDIQIQQMPTVKFTGVYIRETDDDDEDDDYTTKPINGHAYASDPFKQYKPSHPSEINHLATYPSDADTGHRFSNKIVKPTKMPMDSVTLSSQTQLTQAIFHPYEPVPPSPTLRPERKKKPLKIMLNIFPVTPSIDHNGMHSSGRKPQPGYGQSVAPQSNRMIVHLNLYPKKRKQPREQQPVFTSLVPGGPDHFEDRIDGDYENDDSDYQGTIQVDESSQIEEPEEIENTTINPINDSTPDYIFEQEDISSEEEHEIKNVEIDKIVNETPSHLH